MEDYCFQPPFKRGKVLPDKELLQMVFAEEDAHDKTKDDGSHGDCDADALSWSYALTPSQRKCWAKLLQQRKPVVPALALAQLPDDLVFHITSFLDARSLLQMQCVSRKYREMCSRNEAGWDQLCRNLWDTKIHVSEEALKLSSSSITPSGRYTMIQAYKKSMQDARDRQSVTVKELCYDPVRKQGTVWSFRFKESAGSEWTLVDPWYNGEPCRQMVFLRDGTVKQFCPDSSTLSAPRFGTSLPTTRIAMHGHPQHYAPVLEDNRPQNENHANGPLPRENNQVVDPPVTMAWRFVARPMDMPDRPMGSYIRITVGGQDVPTYAVRRSPTGNWGFVMESCWGLFASFNLPTRIPRPVSPTPRERVLRRTAHGNVWLDIMVDELDFVGNDHQDNDIEDDDYTVSDAELMLHASIDGSLFHSISSGEAQSLGLAGSEYDPMLPLRDDSFMVVSNETQWREAFLYNVGARTLPEGDEATDEFDRAWGVI